LRVVTTITYSLKDWLLTDENLKITLKTKFIT
jgi:hypothetical protein